ncbi:MFS transporter [Anaeromyxobacter oryzae]|uniref:MFS transporter n=1 Tax=Anaeromyxobacter oryzae TaxID=2918170 RepID=A0ABM7WVY5_9BACT|nr:MFS transporter [Anaeromyxobacter oryzae]BDG03614.1 MFS transporter [Anaeromyxobacter oryzae]
MPARLPPALRHRDYRNYATAQLLSNAGTQMQQVAVVWQLYVFTRSPLALGILGFFRIAPILLFALGGGVVADAFDRRRLMIFTQSTLAVVSAVLAVTTALGVGSPPLLYALAAVAGTAVAFDAPARHSLVPALVPPEDLSSAMSVGFTGWQVASVAGPAIAGVLLAWKGPVLIFTVDAISFLAVIAVLLTMSHRGAARPETQVGLEAVKEGIRFVRRQPVIRTTMLLDFFGTFFGGSLLLMPIFANELLHVGPRGLGVLYAAQPAGAALAGIFLATRSLPPAQGKLILWAVAIYGAAVAVFGASRSFPVSLLALAISGAADTVSTVIRQTLRNLLTPDALRGRMTSLNMMFFMGGPQLGEVEAGAVARAFGPRISVASGGLLCVAVAAVTAAISPALRRYRRG